MFNKLCFMWTCHLHLLWKKYLMCVLMYAYIIIINYYLSFFQLTWAESSTELFWSLYVWRLSVYPSVCKLFTFSTSSPELLGQFQPKFAQSILSLREFNVVKIKGQAIFSVEMIKNFCKFAKVLITWVT